MTGPLSQAVAARHGRVARGEGPIHDDLRVKAFDWAEANNPCVTTGLPIDPLAESYLDGACFLVGTLRELLKEDKRLTPDDVATLEDALDFAYDARDAMAQVVLRLAEQGRERAP